MVVLPFKLKQNFSDAAAGYDDRAKFQHVQTRRVADAALMLLPEKATLVDVGCGTGYFAAQVSATRPLWQMIGVDVAAGMCAAAAQRCTAVQADATALPLADASVDAVVSSLCLQWVDDLPQAMAEIARVLKPGGRAILASLGTESLQELRVAAEMAELPLGLLPMKGAKDYRAALAVHGLQVMLFEQTADVEYYPTVRALLDSMRQIGAGNNFAAGHGLMGAQRWKNMVAHYETIRDQHGLPATWERLFMVVSKPR